MAAISVIIPAYNVEKYIADTLESILAQTFKDFEVVCVNDGSKDNTLKILEQYALKDNRIKVINQSNSGVSQARNNAFAHASGKYIYYMDSDDLIHPQLLEICYNMAEKRNADVICFGYEEFPDGSVPDFKKLNEDEISVVEVDNFIAKMTAKGENRIYYSACTKFFTKDILNDIRFITGINLAEDALYNLEVGKKNPKTFVFNNKLYQYRICLSSLSHGGYNVKQIISYTKCFERVIELFENEPKTLDILKKDFIPNILKHQVGRCRRANKDKQPDMRHEFAKQLSCLNKLNLLDKKHHRKKMWKFISLLLENKIFKLSICGFCLFSIDLDNKITFGK